MDLQVGASIQRKDLGGIVDEYASAISNSKILRIQSKTLIEGEEETRASSNLDISDREQEYVEAHSTDAGERVLQGDDVPGIMEFEREGSLPPSSG